LDFSRNEVGIRGCGHRRPSTRKEPIMKISEATPDASVSGVELLPVSDAGSPKSVTIDNIKAFIIDAIEAVAAGSSVTGADGVFVLQSGVMKPMDIDTVSQYAIDTIWGKAAEAAPDSADVLALKDGGATEKTVTLALLAEYVRATVEATILDVSDLDSGATLADDHVFLVTQGSTGKKVAFSAISTAIYGALKTYVVALTGVTPADADVLYIVQGGIERKVTYANLMASGGDCGAPATTTEDNLPQWSSTQKTLKDGKAVVTAIRASGTADNLSVPTEAAVRAVLGGLKELWVRASDMVASTTAGVATETHEYPTNDMNHDVLLFAGDTADESAEFNVVMPPEWDRLTIKFKAFWAPAHSDANPDEYISLSLAAGAFANDSAMDSTLGTPVAVVDQAISDDDLHISPASAAITVSGSPALGDLIHFKLTRDYDYDYVGAGTAMDVDLRLFGVLIQYQEAYTVAAW